MAIGSVQAFGSESCSIPALLLFASPSSVQCTFETGYPSVLLTIPTGKQLKQVCANGACQRHFAQLNTAFPRECDFFGKPFREAYLDKIAVACAPATAPPVPTTPAPAPTTPAPAPTTPAPEPTTPAPVPTTPAPVPTTPAPVTNTPAPPPTTPVPTIPDSTVPAPVPTTPAPEPTTPAPEPTTVSPSPGVPCNYDSPASCTRQLVNIDLYGIDLESYSQVYSLGQCCDLCGRNAECKAFVYVPRTSSCYLKPALNGTIASVGLISGLIN